MKLKIQMLRLDSSLINCINKLLNMQMWEIVSVFFNHIDAAFKNWGLFKTHLILLGLFICWCSGNNQKKITTQELASLHYQLHKTQGYYLQNRYEHSVFHEKHGPLGAYITLINSHITRTSLQQLHLCGNMQIICKIPLQFLCTNYMKLWHTEYITISLCICTPQIMWIWTCFTAEA